MWSREKGVDEERVKPLPSSVEKVGRSVGRSEAEGLAGRRSAWRGRGNVAAAWPEFEPELMTWTNLVNSASLPSFLPPSLPPQQWMDAWTNLEGREGVVRPTGKIGHTAAVSLGRE